MVTKTETGPVAADEQQGPGTSAAQASASKGSKVVLGLIIFSLAWYLLGDRFTPTTSQARVQGYVVGVAPKVSGLVTEVWVDNNQEVEEGQRLFQIDQSQYLIAVQKAQSGLDNAQQQVAAGDAAVEAARAQLAALRANAKRAEQDAVRQERLRREDPGTISMRRLEMSRAALAQSRAAVVAAEANVRRVIEQKGGASDDTNSVLKAARSALEQAQLDLANTTIVASSQGLITDLRADVGQYAGAGSPVMTLLSLHDVWVTAEFTENNLGRLQVGGPVEILFDVFPGRVFKGVVRSIGLGVSAGQLPPPGTLPAVTNNRDWLRQSQRFPVIIEFDVEQSKTLFEQLRIGGQATVIAYTGGNFVLNALGKLYIRVMSVFSYAY